MFGDDDGDDLDDESNDDDSRFGDDDRDAGAWDETSDDASGVGDGSLYTAADSGFGPHPPSPSPSGKREGSVLKSLALPFQEASHRERDAQAQG